MFIEDASVLQYVYGMCILTYPDESCYLFDWSQQHL